MYDYLNYPVLKIPDSTPLIQLSSFLGTFYFTHLEIGVILGVKNGVNNGVKIGVLVYEFLHLNF